MMLSITNVLFARLNICYVQRVSSYPSRSSALSLPLIALGAQAIKSASFYTSLHQEAVEEKYGEMVTHTSLTDFTGTAWDLVRAGAQEECDT